MAFASCVRFEISSAGASNAGFVQRLVFSTILTKVEPAQSLRGLGLRRFMAGRVVCGGLLRLCCWLLATEAGGPTTGAYSGFWRRGGHCGWRNPARAYVAQRSSSSGAWNSGRTCECSQYSQDRAQKEDESTLRGRVQRPNLDGFF